MRLVVLWIRRGAGLWLFLPVAGFLVTTAVANHPWQLEFDWGTRNLAASVYVFSPLVAATAAYDVARRVRPTLHELALGAHRGVWAVAAPAVAVLGWALLASSVSWGVIGVIVARSGGLGPSDYWVAVETVAAFAAAAAFGAMLGTYIDGLVAVATAAGGVLICALLLGPLDVSLFQVASSSGTMLGIERTPVRAGFAAACNAGVVFACLLVVTARTFSLRGQRAWVVSAAVVVGAITVTSAVWPFADSEYRPSTAGESCSSSGEVAVCGPAKAEDLWRSAASDLAEARASLAGSGLELPSRFAVARAERAMDLPDGTTLLDYDTSGLVGGHLATQVLATTFATPRACAAFFSSEESLAYLELVETTRSWIGQELQAPTEGAAPADVRAAHTMLATCPEAG